MKNPYTKDKIQSIYAGIPDVELQKRKKNYLIWGIVCIIFYPFILIAAFLLLRWWLISQELKNRIIEHRNVDDPTVPKRQFIDPPHFKFDDGMKLYIKDVDVDNFEIVKTYHTKVVGVTFEDRQFNLEYAHCGQGLAIDEFEWEGKPAYSVCLDDGSRIGNIKESLAADIHDFIESSEKDLFMYGKITDITGGEEGKKTYGCNICVYLLARK